MGRKKDLVSLGVQNDISITLPRTKFKGLRVDYVIENNVQAPINKGDKIGTLEVISENNTVLTADLVALENIEAKGFFGRLWSRFILWIMSLFGMA